MSTRLAAPDVVSITPMTYAIHRSKNNRSLHLVFMESCFEELPAHIRAQGPWQRLKSGEFKNLRSDYKDAITRTGYVIVDAPASVFSAET